MEDNRPMPPDPVEKTTQRRFPEIMHRKHKRRIESLQDLDHSLHIKGVTAIHRHKHHVDPADLLQMFRREGVVQMTKMGDAEVGGLKYKNRVAVVFRAAAPIANVCYDVSHPHITDLQIVEGRAAARVPAAQDVPDGRIRAIGKVC